MLIIPQKKKKKSSSCLSNISDIIFGPSITTTPVNPRTPANAFQVQKNKADNSEHTSPKRLLSSTPMRDETKLKEVFPTTVATNQLKSKQVQTDISMDTHQPPISSSHAETQTIPTDNADSLEQALERKNILIRQLQDKIKCLNEKLANTSGQILIVEEENKKLKEQNRMLTNEIKSAKCNASKDKDNDQIIDLRNELSDLKENLQEVMTAMSKVQETLKTSPTYCDLANVRLEVKHNRDQLESLNSTVKQPVNSTTDQPSKPFKSGKK